MTVPPRLVHLTQGIGSDAPPRRVPQGGGKFAIGQILVGSLQRFIYRLRVDGMFLQASPDRQCRPAGTALSACARQREGGVVDIAEPYAVLDHALKGTIDFRLVMRLKLS